MSDTRTENKETEKQPENEFGWAFHKGPLIAAVVLTALFYIAIFVYVAMD